MVVQMVSVGGGDDNGDDCDAEMRLKTNWEWITFP